MTIMQISTTKQYIVIAGCGLLIACYICFVVVRYLSGYLITISLTSSLLLSGYVLVAASASGTMPLRRQPLDGMKRPAFLANDNWKKPADKVELRHIFPESFVLSNSLDHMLSYIQRDFILSWYKSFTKDEEFPRLVDSEIRNAIEELGHRFAKIDWPELLIAKIVPLLTNHYKNSIKAASAVRDKSARRFLTQTPELDQAVAAEYPGLHPAVALKNLTVSKTKWLKSTVRQMLPLLLSSEEVNSPIVLALVGDILSSAVFFQVATMLSDPDFWNQTISKFATSTIRDQARVEKLRHALDTHTGPATSSRGFSLMKDKIYSTLRLSPNADNAKFEKFLRQVNQISSLAEAKQTRYYISVQLKRTSQTANPQYHERLTIAMRTIERKILELGGKREFSTSDGHDAREDYTLRQMLNDPACCSFFMEFMDLRRKTNLIQFWLAVNSIRDPLDDDDAYIGGSDDDADTELDPLGGIHTEQMAQKKNILTTKKLSMPNLEDIRQIYRDRLQVSEGKALPVSEDLREKIQLINVPNITEQQYSTARKALFWAQKQTYDLLEARYVPKFKRSDSFTKFLATPRINNEMTFSSVDGLQIDLGDDYNDPDPRKPIIEEEQSDVFSAVEEAFNDIMTASTGDLSSTIPPVTSPKSELNEKHSKFRDNLFGSDEENDASFEDESPMVENNEFDGPRMAAPGDLGLTEAISKLSAEISKFQAQKDVLEAMLQKAELTNNSSEQRVLEKSLSSIDRAIQRNELQRQQYIVQESENSLYGRSSILIPSFMSTTGANGHEYVLYCIEVQRKDSEGNVVAGWIVARRYSQFDMLNSYLQSKFPEVRKLSFPKKRMILKLQSKALVEARRVALETYLQELLAISEVCKNQKFRMFLSSNNLDTSFEEDDVSGDEKSGFVSMLSNDDSDSSTTEGRFRRRKDKVMRNQRYSSWQSTPSMMSTLEIDSLEGPIEGSSKSFVQPICELFMTVFGSHRGKTSLRGRAVVIVLQQILGGTVEKRIRENINKLTTAQSAADVVELITNSLWPGGQKKPPGIQRGLSEKKQTAHDAQLLLSQLISRLTAKIVGSSSSEYASSNIFRMYQNEILNAHLVYSTLDVILMEAIPELKKRKLERAQ